MVENHGLGMLITNSDETVVREVAATKLLRENQVDGLIVSPCDVAGSVHLREAVAAGMPMVLIDRKVKDLLVDSVAVENVKGSQEAVARLLSAGHRRIGFIAEMSVPDEAQLPSTWPLAPVLKCGTGFIDYRPPSTSTACRRS